jgi:hypothetical protein
MSRPAERLGVPPLNQIPWGLLDFFGIKNGGRFPQHLSDVLVPTFEMLDWYTSTKGQTVALTGTVIAASAGASTKNDITVASSGFQTLIVNGQIAVPDNEWWIIRRGDIALTLTNTFVGTIGVGMDFIGLQREQYVQGVIVGVATANSKQRIVAIPGPVFVAPGTQINFSYDAEMSAGTATLTADLHITRMLS